MNIVLVLIPLSLVLVALGVWAFFWSVDHAQFDDLDTPALIPLADEAAPPARVDAYAQSVDKSVTDVRSSPSPRFSGERAGVRGESAAPARVPSPQPLAQSMEPTGRGAQAATTSRKPSRP